MSDLSNEQLLAHLYHIEGAWADANNNLAKRADIIRELTDRGVKQAEIWRELNRARVDRGHKELTRDAVSMLMKRIRDKATA